MQRTNPVPRILRGKSAVAAVIDPYGGIRTIINYPSKIKYGHRPYELCLVVPNFRVREPILWNAIPWIVKQAHDHALWWIRSRNDPDYGGFRENVTLFLIREKENPRRTINLFDLCET